MEKSPKSESRLHQASESLLRECSERSGYVRCSTHPLVLPPLSLYIHIPWCVRKCPYCDFNSHESHTALPEEAYIDALLEDLQQDIHYAQGREIQSVFFGGGTPSLFSAESIQRLLRALGEHLTFSHDCEITLEANPGTFEREKFAGFFEGGVNRLSIGVQSFQPAHLERLGRIHNAQDALKAIRSAQDVGFTRINVDLMHGLPDQNRIEAQTDIRTALDNGISHVSWYQLTIEPNTHFHKQPPRLPVEDTLADIQQYGLAEILGYGLQQYEVSAYALPGQESRHNLNYWQFGDYLALGAGAHGKITDIANANIIRYQKTRLPTHYLERAPSRTAQADAIAVDDRPFEFLLNALRLNTGFTRQLFQDRTGLSMDIIEPSLQTTINDGLIKLCDGHYHCSPTGRRFLDDVVARFLG